MIALKHNSSRLILFGLITISILMVSIGLMNSNQLVLEQQLLAIGSTIDITIIIPLCYFLLIRKTKIPNYTTIPVFILSIVLAYRIIPEDRQQTLNYIKLLIGPLELFIVGSLIYNLRKLNKNLVKIAYGNHNFPEALQRLLATKNISKIVANAITTEVSMFYYALFAWKKPSPLKSNQYSTHKTSGYNSLFVALLFILPIETAIFHLLLSNFSHGLAWFMTALSIYSVFFILGDRNAIRNRPVELQKSSMVLRTGMRWTACINYEQIEDIQLRESDPTTEKFINMNTYSSGNIFITLKEEVIFKGLYGFKKTSDKISITIDNHHEFYAQLCKYLTI